jgi:pilus assembly protein Flp/PilA
MGKNSMNLNDTLLKLSIKVKSMLSDERGQDLVEYALVVAIIALGATVAMSTLASDINAVFVTIGTKLTAST